jgi:4-hydroxy-tetrahydrodipicolinate synthase
VACFKNVLPCEVIPTVLLPVRDDLSIDESGLRSHSGTLKRWRDYRRLRSMRIRPRWPHVQPTSSAACWGSQAKGSAIGVSADPRHMAVGSLETAPSQAGAGGRIIGVSGIAAGAFGQTADMTIAHFEAIASASDLSLNVFRYPLATGQGYPVATVIRCSDEIRCICAVKDLTSGAPQHDAQVRPLQSPGPPVDVLSTNNEPGRFVTVHTSPFRSMPRLAPTRPSRR